MKGVSILGSTGSIGTSSLDVIERNPERFRVVALAAGSNDELLAEQVERFRPELVAMADPAAAARLRERLGGIEVLEGANGLQAVATAAEANTVITAVVGAVGLEPTLAAIAAGKDIALANKETLVVAGALVMAAARAAGVEILPVDSEHNALHQAIRVAPRRALRSLMLTASGGPFRTWSAERIASASVADALAHPTWTMGPKITIDSASMMNKGLEIIEACHLFDVPVEQVEVVVHPQSLVHSLAVFVDGSMIAQLGRNDMRLPIAYALAWPERLELLEPLNLAEVARLDFEAPDPERFPALRLAREAMVEGGIMPAVLNAANEVAVAAFLAENLDFPGISRVVEETMTAMAKCNHSLESLEQALEADREARARAAEAVVETAAWRLQ